MGQTLSINRRVVLDPCKPTTPGPHTAGYDPASGMWYRDNVRQAIKQCYRSQREHSKRLANPKTQRQKFVNSKQNSKSLASMDLHSRINKGRKGQTERRNLL